MAMLAERRRRKRYNLVPRGKPLYEDESRFGTKLLEKMGWKKGQGLGANEDGCKDFVRMRYKNDSLGLGFEYRDDQWTQHEQSFNGLLKTLNNEEINNDLNNKEMNGAFEYDVHRIGFGFQDGNILEEKPQKAEKLKEKISGISLEARSKESKARVHYKKFTKGKDLSQYSEQDLANIFGKKAVDAQQDANDLFKQLSNTFGKKQEDSKTKNSIEGEQLINTGVSVSDYFKTKMQAIKNRKNDVENAEQKTCMDTVLNTDQLENFVGKKKKRKKDKKNKDVDDESIKKTKMHVESNSQMIYSNVSVNDYLKTKMEAIKNKKNGFPIKENNKDYCKSLQEEEVTNNLHKKSAIDDEYSGDGKIIKENIENSNPENANITVDKKKEKSCNNENITESAFGKAKHKKKKDKYKNKILEEEQKNIQINPANDYLKTKKRKYKISTEDNTTTEALKEEISEKDLSQESIKKKQKKNRTNKIIDSNNEILDVSIQQPNIEEKKMNSKKLEEPTETSVSQEYLTKTDHNQSVKVQELDLEEIKNRIKEFNIYQISSFCAEKFRHINLDDFPGSILPQIEGYGFDSEQQLNVTIKKSDEMRITNMWSCVLNKYSNMNKPQKAYQKYVKEAVIARKTKQKRPKLYVKSWQRKNVFQVI